VALSEKPLIPSRFTDEGFATNEVEGAHESGAALSAIGTLGGFDGCDELLKVTHYIDGAVHTLRSDGQETRRSVDVTQTPSECRCDVIQGAYRSVTVARAKYPCPKAVAGDSDRRMRREVRQHLGALAANIGIEWVMESTDFGHRT
jgi:hypothetical protein